MTRLCIVDCETTSLSPDNGGEIWELAMIVRKPGEPADREYCWQVRPDLARADRNSVRFARYYERCELIACEPGTALVTAHPALGPGADRERTTARLVAAEAAQLLAGAVMFGTVPDFDDRFLDRFLRENSQVGAHHYHLQDIETIVLGWLLGQHAAGHDVKIPQWPLDSGDLSRAAGVDPDVFFRHQALEDCRWGRAQLIATGAWDEYPDRFSS